MSPLHVPETLCCGCRKIWEELPEDKRERLYFFNSFFWTKLSEKAPQGNQSQAQKADASFERVKRWTRVRCDLSIPVCSGPLHSETSALGLAEVICRLVCTTVLQPGTGRDLSARRIPAAAARVAVTAFALASL